MEKYTKEYWKKACENDEKWWHRERETTDWEVEECFKIQESIKIYLGFIPSTSEALNVWRQYSVANFEVQFMAETDDWCKIVEVFED